MKKVAVLMLVCAAVCAAVLMQKRQSAGPRPSMWDKMREGMEAMPEDFPPRVMFENVAATKENTERILEILDKGEGTSEDPAAASDPGEVTGPV
jgi:hypothetical protein